MFIIFLLVFLALSSIFSSSETAFLSLNRYRLRVREEKGESRAKGIRRMLERIDEFLSTILIGNTISNTAFASITTYIFTDYLIKGNGEKAVLWATIASTVMILLFSEMIPKTIAANYPDELSKKAYPAINFFFLIFKPISIGFTVATRGIMALIGLKKGKVYRGMNKEEIKAMLFSKKEVSDEVIMARGIFMLEDRKVRDAMIPRIKIAAINENASYQEVMEIFRRYRFSRYPIYKNRIDEIIGFLNIKDIMANYKGGKFNIKDFVREPRFFPVYSKLSYVFKQMRDVGLHIAMAVDEFGSVRGLITLEDIIEEVMGEIWDEYEVLRPEKKIEEIGEGFFIIDGDAEIDEVQETLGISIPRENYSTFAGFVFKIMERVPEEGDSFEHSGWNFRIKKMIRNSIIEVEAKKTNENSGNQQKS